MKRLHILWSIFFLLLNATTTSIANDTHTVEPPFLDLVLNEGETTVEQVSYTFYPYCIRPFYIDVIASDPSVSITNLTGVVLNGCGGDTSTFDIEFYGTITPQYFDLQFIDSESGGVLATIPVSITPRQELEPLLGVILNNSGIVFQVYSSGCTQKSDFDLQIMESYPLQLLLTRLNPDPCDAYVPLGTRIFYRYNELGLTPGTELRVLNPLGTAVVP